MSACLSGRTFEGGVEVFLPNHTISQQGEVQVQSRVTLTRLKATRRVSEHLVCQQCFGDLTTKDGVQVAD